MDIKALCPEVARDNHRALKTYSRHGFTAATVPFDKL